MTNVTPDAINGVATTIAQASDNPIVEKVETFVESKLSKPVRAAIYEGGKWVGVGGATASAVAGALDGQAGLFVAAIAAALLAVNAFIAKAHLV